MKKKKNNIMSNVSERDKTLLFGLLAILVLAGTYFLVFSPQMNDLEEIKDTNEQMERYVDQLNIMMLSKEEKKAEIVTFNNNRAIILEKFPGGMTHEKAIDTVAHIEEESGIVISQATLVVNNVFFNEKESKTANLIQPEKVSVDSSFYEAGTCEQNYVDLTGYQTVVTVDFTCSDSELSAALDYINESKDKMSVDNVVVSYDATSGKLAGTMDIMMFAVDGTERTYEKPEISGIDIGVANIFSEKNVKSTKRN